MDCCHLPTRRDVCRSIAHYAQAISVNDSSLLSAGRSYVYWSNGQCAEAVADAEMALSMAPVVSDTGHTDAEAHTVLARCYFDAGQYRNALEHIESALPLLRAHGYSAGAIASWEGDRDFLLEELGDR